MNRRTVLEATVAGGLTSAIAAASPAAARPASVPQAERKPYVTAKDGTKLFVQDWGSGRPVLLPCSLRRS